MADNDKRVLAYLGLAKRAGKVASGEFQTEEAIKRGRAELVLIAGDASDNTKKKFRNMCDWHHVRMVVCSDRAALGLSIGCSERACLALTDTGFAAVIEKTLGAGTDRERRY
jgi:ribosomal protein L7Ae-like RNA K-turn-binding protein